MARRVAAATVHTGPRGGKFYYTSTGEKVYGKPPETGDYEIHHGGGRVELVRAGSERHKLELASAGGEKSPPQPLAPTGRRPPVRMPSPKPAPKPALPSPKTVPPSPPPKPAGPSLKPPPPAHKAESTNAEKTAPVTNMHEKVRAAYEAEKAATGLRNVSIAAIQQRTQIPLEDLHAHLLEEAKAHRINPTKGEITAVNAAEAKAALHIRGQPHLTIELLDSYPYARKPLSGKRAY